MLLSRGVVGSIKPRNLTEEGYGYFGQVIIHVPHGPEGGRGNDKKQNIWGVYPVVCDTNVRNKHKIIMDSNWQEVDQLAIYIAC